MNGTALFRPRSSLLFVYVWTVILTGFILSVLALCGVGRFGSVGASIAYLRGERLVAESPSRSIGSVRPGEDARLGFLLRNLSGDPITVLGARSECACVVAEDLPFAVPPSGGREVGVRLRAPEASGPFTERVALFTDCPGQADVVLCISGVARSDELSQESPGD
jgi:hypothetical protein